MAPLILLKYTNKLNIFQCRTCLHKGKSTECFVFHKDDQDTFAFLLQISNYGAGVTFKIK